MWRILSALAALWDWWNYKHISVRSASVYIALLCAIFYLLGSQRPPADYRALEKQISDSRHSARLFADEMARRNGLLNTLRARDSLSKKTIEVLGGRIDALESQSIQWQQETAFYQHVLENRAPGDSEILIHALDASPDFTRKGWKLSAILARPGKRKSFTGGYYFDIVAGGSEDERIALRLPAENTHALTMQFYQEIENLLDLPPDITILLLRVVIVNKKGETIASAEIGSPGSPAAEDSGEELGNAL